MAGVISRGIQGPIIREGDDIVDIVVSSMYAAEKAEGWSLQNKDVIAVTESVVARAQGNYVTVDQVAKDVENKYGKGKLGLIFPILSRNRFSMCLKGFARAMDEIVILFPTTGWATPSWPGPPMCPTGSARSRTLRRPTLSRPSAPRSIPSPA